ncbi:MAG TPA: alpha/beta hydrolase [Actinomycetes bacterium]|nr:alpha/beta hydrolase [Actinomycetes bacterium]
MGGRRRRSALAVALVTVGGGQQVYAHCSGEGSPTVVLESGDEDDQFQWGGVQAAVAEHTRVCSYDRLGTGSSDPATGCRRTADLLAVLQGMLDAMDAGPPYVLVGTSGGGFIMTSYAYAHPKDTAGIVLAETPHAIIPSQAPQELLDAIDCRAPTNIEQRTNVEGQRGWLVLSPLAEQFVVTTGHDVPNTETELTVREVLRVVEEARG